jgi:membrane protein implicated in regulation of membrane protease activity
MKTRAPWIILGVLAVIGLLAVAGSSVAADLTLAQAALGEGASGLVMFLGAALVLATCFTAILGILLLWAGWVIYKDRMVRGEAKRKRETQEYHELSKKKDPIDHLIDTQVKMQTLDMVSRMNRRE